MQKSEVNVAALMASAIAVAIALKLSSSPFDWLTGIGGLTLLLVLISFDRDGERTVFQSLAYAAVCGLALILVAGTVFQMVATNQEAHSVQLRLVATWLFGTVILWAIDRARMSGRTEAEVPVRNSRRTLLGDMPPPAPSYAPASSYPATSYPPTTAFAPAPAAAMDEPAPAAAMNPIAFAATVQHFAPVEPPPPVTAAPETTIQAVQEAAFPQAPAPLAAMPPAAIAIPSGKEATVYISLVGEGIKYLRSVRTEHLGRDFYRIVEPMPEGESWEYQPGQVVRAKKKNLSSGKALVAFEEAPRA